MVISATSTHSSSAGLDPAVVRWLQASARPSGCLITPSGSERLRLMGCTYEGRLSGLRLQSVGRARFEFQAEPDGVLLLFHQRGSLQGRSGGRPLSATPAALSGVLWPDELLELQIHGPASDTIWLRVPLQELLHLWRPRQPMSLTPDLLIDSITGMEMALLPMVETLLRPTAAQHTERQRTLQAVLQRLETTLLHELVRLLPAEPPPLAAPQLRPSGYHDLCVLAETVMHTQLAQLPDLSTLAEACGCSIRSLQLAFQRTQGLTPMRRLRDLRHKRLHSLLKQGMPVRQACEAAGLPSTGHTASLYRGIFGCTPSQTRQARLAQQA